MFFIKHYWKAVHYTLRATVFVKCAYIGPINCYPIVIQKRRMKILLASLIALSSVTPAMAHHSQRGYSASRDCYKTVYREDYIPGTRSNPGYI